jgi:Zinc knuckle
MAVNPGSSKEKGSKGGARKPQGKCWNCGEKGHFKDKCPKPSKSKDNTKGKNKDKDKASSSANAAVKHNSDSESEGAWVAVGSDDEMALSDDGSMPNLEAISDSSSECSNNLSSNEDWLSKAGDNSSELDDVEWRSDDLPEEVLVTTTPARPGQYSYVWAELYNSGCTQHISPFCEDFTNFSEIPPKAFHAANKQSFSATGRGEMVIDIPIGTDFPKLQLTEVLYSPEVGYTLISIGKLDEKGFSVTFSGGKCTIHGPDGRCVGEVPKSEKGLYKVQHEKGKEANIAKETLTLDMLHWCLGHIFPQAAKKLINKGFVTGMQLETTSDADLFCESCIYAKATRKSIFKVRKGEHAMEFGGETHSDMWGPAPVETKGGKHYYITYTDDKTWFTNLYLLSKESSPTKTTRPGVSPSWTLASKLYTLTEEENIWERNSYYI